jgi:hypothetical protein
MVTPKAIRSIRHEGWPSILILVAGLMAGCGGSIPAPSSSTSNTTVTLQGQLTDSVTGEPIVGAQIDIGSRSATTDINGYYLMGNFPANSSGGVARDYLATVTLTGVTSPVDMTNAAATPRYPDIKFAAPVSPGTNTANTTHDFKVGKLSANIQGVVGDSNLSTIGGVIIELQDNTPSVAGNVIRTATSDPVTGGYVFANVEAGVDYKLVGRTGDSAMQGNVTTGKLSDNQTLSLPLGGTPALILSSTDTYSPRIIQVSPENGADVAPGTVNVVFTFNEPIRQNSYSIPDPSAPNNIYYDINVSYGGMKAVGNYAHTMTWNATFDALTVTLPDTGISSKFTVDLSLLSPISTTTSGTTTTTLGKLTDNAGNKLENSPVLTSGHLLSFTTNGGAPAVPPVILSPNAPGLDRDATSVTLDWQPAYGATKGYNIYRSASMSGVVGPFVMIAGPVTASTYTDTYSLSGFNLLPYPEVAQSYVYRVTSINSDLIESAPSNELLIRDAVAPSTVGTAGICVAPGGNSLTVTNPVTVTTNGQVQFTFSEPLDVIAAETVGNYTGANISAAKLTTPTTIVLDFSAPITCVNTNTVTIGVGVKDVAGNALSGSLAQRTLTYVP